MDENESLETLFAGLAAEPVQQRSPFKFLDAYGAADRALFFGRDNEIRDLYARFYRGRVVLVYGESGTGKTSLIECGLRSEIPAEEALFVDGAHRARPVRGRAAGAAPGIGVRAGGLELGSLVREVIEQKSKTLVLVFDQFEEFFLFQPASVRQAFATGGAGLAGAERESPAGDRSAGRVSGAGDRTGTLLAGPVPQSAVDSPSGPVRCRSGDCRALRSLRRGD